MEIEHDPTITSTHETKSLFVELVLKKLNCQLDRQNPILVSGYQTFLFDRVVEKHID